jgi:peptide/nickel transport system permease protein
MAGAILISALLLFVLIGFAYTPYPPNQIDREAVLRSPGLRHLFGTDNLGRDIFSRAMYAGRTAFAVGVCSAAVSFAAGVLLGAVSGDSYRGGGKRGHIAAGAADAALTRFSDVMRCIPSILLAMMIIAVFGASFFNTVAAVSIIFIPSFYRMIRGGVIQIKDREYVIWARRAGIGRWRVMFMHILPNLTSSIIVMISMTIAQAILTETALTYLGLGVQPPTPGWGRMLSEAQRNILSAPWESVSVGACVSAIVLGFNLLGDGLRDILDVKLI